MLRPLRTAYPHTVDGLAGVASGSERRGSRASTWVAGSLLAATIFALSCAEPVRPEILGIPFPGWGATEPTIRALFRNPQFRDEPLPSIRRDEFVEEFSVPFDTNWGNFKVGIKSMRVHRDGGLHRIVLWLSPKPTIQYGTFELAKAELESRLGPPSEKGTPSEQGGWYWQWNLAESTVRLTPEGVDIGRPLRKR